MSTCSTKPLHAHRAQRVLDSLQKFAADVQASVNNNLPTGAASYSKVAVLGFTWSNDDMNCQQAETELFKVLRKHYNFDTESYVILAAAGAAPTNNLISEFLRFKSKHDADDALLIFVYLGHSDRNQRNQLELYGNLSGQAPIISWNAVAGAATVVDGRCLLIFDSCFAATAGTMDYYGPELLAASGINNPASGSPICSFTSMLKDQLERLGGRSHTVSRIYSDLCRNALQNQLDVFPVHFLQSGKDSVVLERIPAASTALETGTQEQRDEAVKELGDGRYRVLIQVHLRGDVPQTDIEQWDKWLSTNLPTMAGKITLEAKYSSQNSTVLHVSMPLEVWDGLPADNSAYSFVAFIMGI